MTKIDEIFQALTDHPQCSQVSIRDVSSIILYVNQNQYQTAVTIEAVIADLTVDKVKAKLLTYLKKGEYVTWLVMDKGDYDEKVLKFLEALNFGKLYRYKSDTLVTVNGKVLDLVDFKAQVRKKYYSYLPMATLWTDREQNW